MIRTAILTTIIIMCIPTLRAQNGDDDIFRELELQEFQYQRPKNYCQRLYGYYRYIDDGTTLIKGRQQKLYRVYEGVFELDVRYNKDEDDGATVIAGRDLVHPEKSGKFVEFYELQPYTFLEHARKHPKVFTLKTSGDTTRIYSKRGLSGTAIKDKANEELRIDYNALAPDTTMSLNLIIIRARLSNVFAKAVYRLDDVDDNYVPQGYLKHIVFDGDIDVEMSKDIRDIYHEHTELYIDSVAYLTKEEYKADKKISKAERTKRHGYTAKDIDRLKEKLGVAPLSAEIYQRIEDQRDWEDDFEQMREADKRKKTAAKVAEKIAEKNK